MARWIMILFKHFSGVMIPLHESNTVTQTLTFVKKYRSEGIFLRRTDFAQRVTERNMGQSSGFAVPGPNLKKPTDW